MTEILVVYYSRDGSVAQMANLIARGIESVAGCSATLRTVPPVSPETEVSRDPVPEQGPPYVNREDLERCAGIALGSPAYFGSLAAPMKYFLDRTTPGWFAGALAGKPAAVFTSSSTWHGGQETTLLSMMVPLLHHGALIVGIPYTEPELTTTRTGGTPYGATHIAGQDGEIPFSAEEERLCQVLGRRLAGVAARQARA